MDVGARPSHVIRKARRAVALVLLTPVLLVSCGRRGGGPARHHLCMIYRYRSVQWAGTAVVSLAFVALWTIIGVVQWKRSRRVREQSNG